MPVQGMCLAEGLGGPHLRSTCNRRRYAIVATVRRRIGWGDRNTRRFPPPPYERRQYPKEGGRILAETAGYDHCFIKPFDTKVLLQLVASYCKKQLSPLGLRWRESHERPPISSRTSASSASSGARLASTISQNVAVFAGGVLASDPLRSSEQDRPRHADSRRSRTTGRGRSSTAG
jgi:hypothetical protein